MEQVNSEKVTTSPNELTGLRAPQADFGLLLRPEFPIATAQISENQRLFSDADLVIGNQKLTTVRVQAKQDLLAAAREYSSKFSCGHGDKALRNGESVTGPIILCGHQPQLPHAGVWSKNLVADQLARATGGVAVNIVVDNDTIRSRSLLVPAWRSSDHGLQELTRQSVPFDLGRSKIPWEEVVIEDPRTFEVFAQALQTFAPQLFERSFLNNVWPEVIQRSRREHHLRDLLTFLRRRTEEQVGASLLDVPLSEICQLPVFASFFGHLVLHARQFAIAHNAALHDYRVSHHIAQTHVPFRDLAIDQDWIETPFWIWHAERPIRRALFVNIKNQKVILSDRRDWSCEWSLQTVQSPDALRTSMQSLSASGFRIRTRAVSTTMLSRMFLSDTFIHGIGGAIYDEITDALISGFWEYPIPAFQVVSATLRLPIPDVQDLQPLISPDELDRTIRDWKWNPQHLYDSSGELLPSLRETFGERHRYDIREVRQTLIDLRSHLTLQHSRDQQNGVCHAKDCVTKKQQRKSQWHATLGELKSKLRNHSGITQEQFDAMKSRSLSIAQQRQIAQHREYACVLFPEEKLQQFESRVRAVSESFEETC